MASITHFEFNSQAIRESNGLFSIYDIIRVLGRQKSPHKVWERLSESFPEVVTKSQYFKFPGRGQRLTPVCNREVALEIIGLLPGTVGKMYRQDAARLFIRYVDADITLADEVIQKQTDNKSLEWIKERVEGKIVRKQFTDELQARGVQGIGYAMNTDALNVGLFDHTAKELKAIRQVSQTRDGLSKLELTALRFAELKAIKKMEDKNATGNWNTTKCSKEAAKAVRIALDD